MSISSCFRMIENLIILGLLSLVGRCLAWPSDPVPHLHIKPWDVIGQRFLGNESHVEHFKLLERAPTFILIGARNAIYNISLHDLTEIADQRVQWPSTDAHRELCYLKGPSNDDCQNYVRVFGRQGPDKFLACGTNAYKPQCRQFILQDGSYVGSGDTDGLGLCPYDPQHNSTAVFAGGQLYAATVADFSGGEPLIHREKIRTERSDLNQLNGPNFVSSFAYGDYVFFFYRETAVEYMNCGKAVYSRVGRVCQHDKGGPHAFSDRWTSFLKARLNCSVPGEYPFYFNEIQSMSDVTEGFYAGRHDQLIYGIFTTPVNSIGGSAVCAFAMSSVLEVFQGAFKEQETINSNWLRVLPEKVPELRPGACVNDSRTLPDITVNFVKTHPLMDDAVQSFFALPVLTKVSFNYRFTKVAVDPQVKALDGRTYDILYIGTDDGRVIKALNTKAPDSLTEVGQVIVSDVQVLRYGTAIKDLQVVHLAGEASKLVVIADSEIRAIPLHHCDSQAANSCVACVALQDPHCAWDEMTHTCVAVPTKLHDNDASKTLFQDIINGKHKGCGYKQVSTVSEMAKPVLPVVPPSVGRGELPDERDNEIVIELDRENQYSRTQPRANEPQGVIVTPAVYSAQTLTGALIGTCFFSLIAGFASGFWFSQRLRGTPYPDPPEQRQQLNRLTESSESPAGFNNKSINLVLNVPPKNPNGKNANSSAENKPMQKVKKTYI
ncbi:semaphorin-1A-like isoform X1 [Diachasmimorpha longicaudata]|uniref:semaphorin-1A-like isoform X1 n=1 Tax=Diachasmimorpha longicaudata TaxID=58733 RepID=UPI0030B87A69